MKQTLIFCALALVCVCGTFVESAQANQAEEAVKAAVTVATQNVPTQQATANPAVGSKVTPTEARVGYTRAQIRSMPLLSRPNRPGHFIGNTIRRRNAR